MKARDAAEHVGGRTGDRQAQRQAAPIPHPSTQVSSGRPVTAPNPFEDAVPGGIDLTDLPAFFVQRHADPLQHAMDRMVQSSPSAIVAAELPLPDAEAPSSLPTTHEPY